MWRSIATNALVSKYIAPSIFNPCAAPVCTMTVDCGNWKGQQRQEENCQKFKMSRKTNFRLKREVWWNNYDEKLFWALKFNSWRIEQENYLEYATEKHQFWSFNLRYLKFTRKYMLCWYSLSVQKHKTSWDQHWGGNETAIELNVDLRISACLTW